MAGVAPEEQGLVAKKKTPADAPGIVVDDKQIGKAMIPETVAFLVELCFCILITLWHKANEAEKKNGMGVEDAWGGKIVWVCWGIFVFFIIARIVCVVGWKGDFGPDNTWAGLFMFFSTFQFILYMACYYSHQEAWTYKTVASTSLLHNMTLAVPAGTGYIWDCTAFVAGTTCDADTTVTEGANVKQCCTIITYTLKTPATNVICSWPMSQAYSAIRWLSYLSMSFIWKDIPFMKSTSADKDFMTNVWLDILDCVLMGAVYIDSTTVLHHKYGIDRATSRAIPPEAFAFNFVFWTWFVCFSLALISPMLYICLQCMDHGDPIAKRTLDDVQNDIISSLALLDDDKANTLIKEDLQMQRQAYKENQPEEDKEEKVNVVSTFDTTTGKVIWPADSSAPDFRPGKAVLCKDDNGDHIAGYYDLVYDDDKEESKVHVSRIVPDLQDDEQPKKSLTGTCCVNWCQVDHLCNNPDNEYERFATLLDHIRTVFLLDLPFGIIRYKYASSNSMFGIFTDFMMLKNIIWGTINFLLILTCGKETATCCTWPGLSFVLRLVKGSKLAAPGWIGPGGLVRLATDAATEVGKDQLEAKIQQLTLHRSWLVLQLDQFDDDDSDDQQIYQEQITHIEGLVKDLKEDETFVHM